MSKHPNDQLYKFKILAKFCFPDFNKNSRFPLASKKKKKMGKKQLEGKSQEHRFLEQSSSIKSLNQVPLNWNMVSTEFYMDSASLTPKKIKATQSHTPFIRPTLRAKQSSLTTYQFPTILQPATTRQEHDHFNLDFQLLHQTTLNTQAKF